MRAVEERGKMGSELKAGKAKLEGGRTSDTKSHWSFLKGGLIPRFKRGA